MLTILWLFQRCVNHIVVISKLCLPYCGYFKVVFTNKSGKDMLQSFSLPFLNMRSVELEQPVFGANYIKGQMIAEQGGNYCSVHISLSKAIWRYTF